MQDARLVPVVCGAPRPRDGPTPVCVLPEVAYRQWTLSLPRALCFRAAKDTSLLRTVERELVRAIFRWQRRRAKALGMTERLSGGAVAFVQLFNSQLQLQPHLHLLVPEGMFGADFVALPPPGEDEVHSVLSRVLSRLERVLSGDDGTTWAEDALEALQKDAAQLRFHLEGGEVRRRRGRRVAVERGFSLHADTHVHANDRAGLARLARYGARGPIAESRLARREDGTYTYRTKRGGSLTLTAEPLVSRLLCLIPPRGMHLTRYHGVLSSHAAARAQWAPEPLPADALAAEPTPHGKTEPAGRAERKRPRLDWATLHARTWAVDVWRCPCGGRRKVVAVVTSRRTAEVVLKNMGRFKATPPLPAACGPPQHALAL